MNDKHGHGIKVGDVVTDSHGRAIKVGGFLPAGVTLFTTGKLVTIDRTIVWGGDASEAAHAAGADGDTIMWGT